ncbi:MAG: carboxylate--amine ligase [Raoultibacter sp.]
MPQDRPTNADYTAEFFALAAERNGDIAGRRATRAYMENSTAIVHHRVVDSSFVPRLYNNETYTTMRSIAETTHTILCKVINHYLDDPAYRSVFSYDARLVDLILLPRGYDAVLPFARVDAFINEDDYSAAFCEFNADGSSGMNENREITASVRGSATLQAFAAKHHVEGCELFDSWADEFLAIYATYKHRVENPRIAICDFLENAVVDEFQIFCDLFAARGISCVVCDVRDLHFDGQVLRDGTGQPVHAIWRRSVTNDIIDHWEESQDLIAAVRAESVALIGSFAGHIVHDKQIFEALFHPLTQAFLTPEEIAFTQDLVPKTTFLDSAHIDLATVRDHKDDWIIKPTDAYGAADVYAGCFFEAEAWNSLINRFANGAAGAPFLVQRYITPYKTMTLPADAGIENLSDAVVDRQGVPYNNLSGLYLYNGKFTGVFSRLGPLPTISKDMRGITAATLWVDREAGEEA